MISSVASVRGLAIAALVALVAGCGGGRDDRMNVIFVVVDTLRADRMSLYGYERPTTPELEEFASTATTFELAYSPASWTRPSVASYFTGLYPSAHGCQTKDDVLDAAHLTLAELLKEQGYRTAGIHSNQNIGAVYGFDQGFDEYQLVPPNASYPGDFEIADAVAVNELAFSWLRNRPADSPFFLFLLYVDPHDPYLPHEDFWFGSRHEGEFYEGSRKHLAELDGPKAPLEVRRTRPVVKDLYDGEVAYVDSHLGRLFDLLDEEGLADDTIVILVSDHGEGLWDHGHHRAHGQLVYEELIHVPLVVRWPGRTVPGARVVEAVQAFGLFGALAEEFGGEGAHQAPSLLPYLGGTAPEESILVEEKSMRADLAAWIEWPRKLIYDHRTGRGERYNLRRNPREQPRPGMRRNLPEDFVAALDSVRVANQEWNAAIEFRSGPAEPTEEELEALRALGYIE